MTIKKGYLKPPVNPHHEPYIDDLNSLFESLHEHDDRGIVLTLAAFAEDTLGLLLLAYMREEKQAKELVEGFNAPFGTFSARIKAAFSLGLMLNDSYNSLEILRKIRNEFAHNWDGVSLDRQDIHARISQLTISSAEDINIKNGCTEKLTDRYRLQNKMFDVIGDLRLMAKWMVRDGTKLPLIATKIIPVRVKFIEVDSLDDPLPDRS